MFILIGTFDNCIDESHDVPAECSCIEEVHSIYKEWKTYSDFIRVRLFECVEVEYVHQEKSGDRNQVYVCSKGHRFPTNTKLPMIGVDILENKTEPVCPICLGEYHSDKIRNRKALPPYPMKIVYIK